jgi:hypothetical protein
MGDIALWLSAVLSIPTGIVTGLATPAIQRWLESRGQDNALRRRVQAAKAEYELARIENFRRKPSEFTQYLVYIGVKISFISAAIGIVAGIAFLVAQFLSAYQADVSMRAAEQGEVPEMISQFVVIIPSAVGQLVSIVGGVMILRAAGSALTTWTRVRNFDTYRQSVEATLEPQ